MGIDLIYRLIVINFYCCRCAHVFCSNCINDVIESADLSPTCPLCRADIDEKSMLKVPQTSRFEEEDNYNKAKKHTDCDDDNEPFISSSKVTAISYWIFADLKNYMENYVYILCYYVKCEGH